MNYTIFFTLRKIVCTKKRGDILSTYTKKINYAKLKDMDYNVKLFKTKKITLAIVSSILLIAISLFALHKCIVSKKEGIDRQITNQEKVILNYYTWDDELFYIEPIVEQFNIEHPDIQIHLETIESNVYDEQILQLLKKEENVDILGVRGISKMVQYKEQELLHDITPYIQKSDFDVTAFGNMYNNISIEGKIYGMPTRSTSWALLYNKEIFDKANLQYPEQMTWEEYAQLAVQLTDLEKAPVQWGGYWVTWDLNFGGITRTNYLFDDDLTYCKESLAWMNRFMNVYKINKSARQMRDDLEWLELFEQGQVAMLPQGEWSVGMLLKDQKNGVTDVEWDLAPMPVFDGQASGTTWGQYQFTAVTSASLYPEEAFEFIEFLSGEIGAKIYARYGMLSAYTNDDVKKIYKNAVGEKNTDVFFDAYRIQEQPVFAKYEELDSAFKDIGERYLKQEIGLDEAMKGFKEYREVLFNKE